MIFHVIHLKGVSILEQLQLEEKLLREDSRNFCIFNEGSSPAIVMGISGKPDELIQKNQALKLGFPVIKRFSGGGTVVVDEDTLFVSFLCNKNEFAFPSYPENILKWSEEIYKGGLKVPGFSLRENDFVIENHKCGGNAQYIKKDRFIQHTSFLWNFSKEKMESLTLPKVTPKYREGRSHTDFLCSLNNFLPSKEAFFQKIQTHIQLNHEVIQLPYFKGNAITESRISILNLSK